MAMNQCVYDSVLEVLSREPSFSEGLCRLKEKLPAELYNSISEKTFKSIQAQYYVRRMRRNAHHHYGRETREKYYRLYKQAKQRGEEHVIIRLAAKNDISSSLLARIILEEYFRIDVIHDPSRIGPDGKAHLPPGFMTDCIRDIAKLPNPDLATEIYQATAVDNFYGPAVDSIKKSCGVEYEIILKNYCYKAGLSFIDEDQMRFEGYDKTPDIKLTLPILINKRVVNWIESKASFGDPINHQQYMIDQFLPYKNRFGPGAVIYWFGYVKELGEVGDREILLLDKFPEREEIVQIREAQNAETDYSQDNWFLLKDKDQEKRIEKEEETTVEEAHCRKSNVQKYSGVKEELINIENVFCSTNVMVDRGLNEEVKERNSLRKSVDEKGKIFDKQRSEERGNKKSLKPTEVLTEGDQIGLEGIKEMTREERKCKCAPADLKIKTKTHKNSRSSHEKERAEKKCMYGDSDKRGRRKGKSKGNGDPLIASKQQQKKQATKPEENRTWFSDSDSEDDETVMERKYCDYVDPMFESDEEKTVKSVISQESKRDFDISPLSQWYACLL